MRCRPGGHASVSPFGIPPHGGDNFLGGASGRIYCPVPTKLVTLKLPQRCAGLGAAMLRWMLEIFAYRASHESPLRGAEI